jgi:hypothetical protein
MKNKVGVFCAFFGNLPQYFDLTFESMASNKKIDWYLFTDDNKSLRKTANNVKIFLISFKDFKEMTYAKLGVFPRSSYKLCDYKPFYNILFEKYTCKYEYYGYYDLDVIYGNLDELLEKLILQGFDKIFDLGHFSIIRNSSNIKSLLFFKIGDCSYKDMLEHKYICIFDEMYSKQYGTKYLGVNGLFLRSGFKLYNDRKAFADISIKYNCLSPLCLKKGNYYFIKNGKEIECHDENGAFVCNFVYIHLQKRKMGNFVSNCKRYYIFENGFFDSLDYFKKGMIYIRFDYLKIWLRKKKNKIEAKIWQIHRSKYKL